MQILFAALGSGALFAFIEYLIRRHDERKGTLASIQTAIEEIKQQRDEDKATEARRRILSASDEIRHYDVKHSKEWFDQLNLDIDEYESYCDEHEEYRNNRAVMAIRHLKDVYAKCMENNNFL